MARFIDADRLILVLEKNFGNMGGANTLKQLIDKQPTADVVEVRNCEQCEHFVKHATQYPCSHCRNCYTDKFKEKGGADNG